MKIFATAISFLVVELILLVLFVQSGLYNVSTLSPDPGFLHWIFSRTSDNSAQRYSEDIVVPPLTASSMIEEGSKEYRETCEICHGAPGKERSDVGQGLYPHPPNLVNSAKDLKPGRLFWVIKNGIKSTGMPGFAATHTDQRIWEIVAFLEKMKDMTPQEYEAYPKTADDKSDPGSQQMDVSDHSQVGRWHSTGSG